MVDIMTSPTHDLPVDKKDIDVEDGELPEEGEIEDDEEEVKSAPAPARPSVRHSRFSPIVEKPVIETSAQEAWERSLKDKSGGGAATSAAPVAAPVAVAEVAAVAMDQDYRQTENTGDKDYRWPEQPPAHENGFGDSDYRDVPRHERRRRRSPTPEDRVKRSRFSPPPLRRGPGGRRRWTERTICKFFREGYCRDGDNCAYSHQASDSNRKPELCKFYQSGFCKKGLQCNLLHGEFPCKAFHKGECSRDPCQFSHQPLTDYTRPMFEQMMRDEELSARIQLPAAPLRRKVLIPGGPMQPPVSAAQPVLVAPVQPDPVLNGGVLPPPSVVVPQLASVPLGLPMPPAVVPQPSTSLPPLPYPPQAQFYPPTSTVPAMPVETSALAQSSGADSSPANFNINNLLAQLAGGSASDVVDESPASPPMSGEAVSDVHLLIPSTQTIAWRLVPVEVVNPPYLDISNQIINMTVKNDPRMSRLISSQFDAVSSIIGKTVSTSEPAPASSMSAIPSTRPVDPRAAAPVRDPRRRPTEEQQRSSDDRPRSWFPEIGSSSLPR